MFNNLSSFLNSKFDLANLQQRTISSFILAPIILLAIYAGGLVYAVVVILFMSLAMHEWLRMVDSKMHSGVMIAAYAALLVTLGISSLQFMFLGALLGVLLSLILFITAICAKSEKAGWITLGMPYLAGGGMALLMIRNEANVGMELAFYLMLTIWACDTGAFLSGRIIGGAKLLPVISPQKTWAGLFGGIAFACLLGYVCALGFGAAKPVIAGILALFLAAVSQLGDIFESYVKRRSGLKDSGSLIPGHGGILDRIDGLLFAAIFLALFQKVASKTLQWW